MNGGLEQIFYLLIICDYLQLTDLTRMAGVSRSVYWLTGHENLLAKFKINTVSYRTNPRATKMPFKIRPTAKGVNGPVFMYFRKKLTKSFDLLYGQRIRDFLRFRPYQ